MAYPYYERPPQTSKESAASERRGFQRAFHSLCPAFTDRSEFEAQRRAMEQRYNELLRKSELLSASCAAVLHDFIPVRDAELIRKKVKMDVMNKCKFPSVSQVNQNETDSTIVAYQRSVIDDDDDLSVLMYPKVSPSQTNTEYMTVEKPKKNFETSIPNYGKTTTDLHSSEQMTLETYLKESKSVKEGQEDFIVYGGQVYVRGARTTIPESVFHTPGVFRKNSSVLIKGSAFHTKSKSLKKVKMERDLRTARKTVDDMFKEKQRQEEERHTQIFNNLKMKAGVTQITGSKLDSTMQCECGKRSCVKCVSDLIYPIPTIPVATHKPRKLPPGTQVPWYRLGDDQIKPK